MGEGRPERVRALTVAPQAWKRRAVSRPGEGKKGWSARSGEEEEEKRKTESRVKKEKNKARRRANFKERGGGERNTAKRRTDVSVPNNSDRQGVELPDEVAADALRRDPLLLDVGADGDGVETVVEHEDLYSRGMRESDRFLPGGGGEKAGEGEKES